MDPEQSKPIQPDLGLEENELEGSVESSEEGSSKFYQIPLGLGFVILPMILVCGGIINPFSIGALVLYFLAAGCAIAVFIQIADILSDGRTMRR